MISIKRTFLTLCLALIAIAGFAQNEAAWKALEKPLNFYLVNDLGNLVSRTTAMVTQTMKYRPAVNVPIRFDCNVLMWKAG